MKKTTIYLHDVEVQALRQLAVTTGTSQAELIRESIRRLVAQAPERQFRSLGQGVSTASRGAHWSPSALYDKAFGRH